MILVAYEWDKNARYAIIFQQKCLWTYGVLIILSYIIVTLVHKTGHKGPFFKIEIYTSQNHLKICNLGVHKNLNIEKIAFKVVQMKFLAMHITN